MKLASVKSKDPRNRHGDLVVVSRDGKRAARPAANVASTMMQALENWAIVVPQLQALSEQLNSGNAPDSFALNLKDCLAPLPQAPGFYDGSAFLSHVVRARRARGDEMPASAKVTPLMYQGVSDNLLGPFAPIDLVDPAYGADFEGEFAVITADVPRGVSGKEASKYFALFVMFNDITLREIVKTELETKFGFLQSKPNSSFAPFAVTPDELGKAWDGQRLALDLTVKLNGQTFGHPNGREMHFTFGDLVAHAARTRPLAAGSIVGTGTISNEDKNVGFACLTEKRFQEVLDNGKPSTPWLKAGDRVEMDVWVDGVSLFGPIDETAR